MTTPPLADLESLLQYRFRDQELLRAALRHGTYHNEPGAAGGHRAKGLAFLGDAVIELAMRARLVEEHGTDKLGQLSETADKVVLNHRLGEIADGMRLGRRFELGKGGNRKGEREDPTILADALEAIVGAIYLDAKDAPLALDVAAKIVTRTER